jgi:hypothetical protein
MLTAARADIRRVIARTLRLVSVASCLLVVASFAMFARDQVAGASKHQQNALVSSAPIPGDPTGHGHAQPRRFIDGAANTLTSPFRALMHSGNEWVRNGLPTILALVVYGLGLGFVARFARGPI